MLFLNKKNKKWKLYLYLKNVCVGKIKINEDEAPGEHSYVVNIWFKKYLFHTNHVKVVVKPKRLLFNDEEKKETHWDFIYETGVEV